MEKIILLLLMFVCCNSFSQDTAGRKTNQIRFKAFGGWRMDGKKISIKNFKNEIYKVPAAIPAYTKSEKNIKIGYVCAITGSILTLLGQPVRDIGSPRFGKNNTAFKIGGIIFIGTAVYLIFRSNKQLKQAVRIHNESQPLLY